MPYKNPEDQRYYQRIRIAKRRAEYFTGKFCVKCKSIENLELDHIDPDRKVNHRIWSWSREKRDNELLKCQVLCNTCHKEKSSLQQLTRTHGSKQMYNIGCRCDRCKEAVRNIMREYRLPK